MTIVVGARYPWGELNTLLPRGSYVHQAIILAADSRFSKRLANGYRPLLDVGTKLFQLGKNAAAVYAGISEVGEKCMSELRRRLPRHRASTPTPSREIAKSTFQTVYKDYLTSRKVGRDNSPLYILIGACDRGGQAELCLFGYDRDFEPEAQTGLKALGFPDTVKEFDDLLHSYLLEEVQKELSLRRKYPDIPIAQLVPMPIKDGHVAIFVTAALSKIIESGSDTTIGGMVQCALVNAQGVSFPEISHTTGDPLVLADWTRASAKPDELRTVTGEFGVHNLGD